MRPNSRAFTPEEAKAGLMGDLLRYLLGHNAKSEDAWYDIHIWTDGYCQVVEWCNRRLKDGFGDPWGFEFVDDEHEVLKRVEFPDGHWEYMPDSEEGDAVADFLERHPGEYERDGYGGWREAPKDGE